MVPFPFGDGDDGGSKDSSCPSTSPLVQSYKKWAKHPAVVKLARLLDLENNCGYITMVNIRGSTSASNRSTADNYLCVLGDPNVSVPETPHSIKLSSLPEESNTDDEEEFHVIPTTHQNLEPANGFKSDQCAKLYQEELDLELQNASTPSFDVSKGSTKPTGFDARQQKIESLRLELNIEESIKSHSKNQSERIVDGAQPTNEKCDKTWYDDWTLLDCHFGIPLFDSSVSRIVCEKILSNALWEEERFETKHL